SQKQFRTISGRTEMWRAMWKSYWKSPWIGHGYFVTTEKGQVYVWDEWGNWTAHNTALQVLTTTGLIGALLFVTAIAIVFLPISLHVATHGGYNDPESWFLLFIGLWYLLWGQLSTSIIGPTSPEVIVFSILFALSVVKTCTIWQMHEAKCKRKLDAEDSTA
ncbi:MAG: O-antigen ligase family protein, partial [Planctomycetota bacterium]